MIKKRFVTLFVLMALVSGIKAQISTCSLHDGYWGDWKKHTTSYGQDYHLFGDYSGFIIYRVSSHPSEYFFKFKADTYTAPDKATIKYHRKNNLWYEYSGTVEYYVTESYPTIEAVLRTFEFPCFDCNSGSNGNPCVKRTARAIIKIAPYKKRPECYNIYFDNVGVGISFAPGYGFKQ